MSAFVKTSRKIAEIANNLPQAIGAVNTFVNTYGLLNRSQYWPIERLREYQLQQLICLVRHSYENIPFYKERWQRAGFHPDDIKALNDIKLIPFTTKRDIQENMLSDKTRYTGSKRYGYVTTGGSTGIPFGFFEEKYVATAREMAFIYRLWGRVGYKPGDKRVVLRGKVVESAKNGKFGSYDPIRRELTLSSYHMTDENLPVYIKMINDFRGAFIHAYPSSITILADYMRRKGIGPFKFLKAILVGSENLYEWQRELLENVFQCRIYSWYGHAEKAVLAGECEERHHYHIFPEYGITELLDNSGRDVKEEGDSGEIVATGFNNLATPFIRYRTMDIGVLGARECSCGRNYPILKNIGGRLQEFIVSGDNRLISMTAINMHNSLFDNIRQFQFYQDRIGEVDLNLVRAESYTEYDDIRIQSEIGQKLGNRMKLTLKYCDEIPRTNSGKFRFLIQKLPVKYND